MKIALVGAPGSCKTCVAHQITDHFPTEGHVIVDDYVSRLSEKTDIEFGHFAGYLGNLQVAFERIRAEQVAWNHAPNLRSITCGSLIETVAYTTLHAQVALSSPNLGDQQAEFNRMGAASAAFGMLLWDTWRYDLTFFLPYSDEQVEEKNGTWDAVLDANLPTALESFFIDYTRLEGTTSARAEQAAEKIKEATNAAASVSE